MTRTVIAFLRKYISLQIPLCERKHTCCVGEAPQLGLSHVPEVITGLQSPLKC